MAVADGSAAGEGTGVFFAETAFAGRHVELVVVAVEHFEADDVQRPHLAAGGLVIAADGFQTTAIGQARVKAHMREELARLPNCSCLETVRRDRQPAGGQMRPLDTVRLGIKLGIGPKFE